MLEIHFLNFIFRASANLKCIEDKGQLASFEDIEEIRNFRKVIVGGKASEEFLTSAIHFGQELDQGWTWIGSSNDIVDVYVNANLRFLEKKVPYPLDF